MELKLNAYWRKVELHEFMVACKWEGWETSKYPERPPMDEDRELPLCDCTEETAQGDRFEYRVERAARAQTVR